MRTSVAATLATRAAAAALAALAMAGAPHAALAGTIGFRTDAEVTAGPGIDAKVTVTHTGDEAASDVSVHAELLDRKMDGDKVVSIEPGKSHVWNFRLFDEVPGGVYAIVLRVRYEDANGYEFEVVSSAIAAVGVKAEPRIFGSIDIPALTVGGESTGKLTAKKPPGRTGRYEAVLVVPSGLAVTPERLPLDFDAAGKATASFTVRNLKLLAGTSVNVFGLVTGEGAGFPQVDSIRGAARVAAARARVVTPMFYQAAAAFLVLLAVLEGIAWARARRRIQE